MTHSLSRRLAAEFAGSAILLAGVVGSGIMGERLSGGNVALALLANAVATGGVLFAIILTFGAISGAHFNPAVSLVMLLRREIGVGAAVLYFVAQIVGCVAGVVLAHAMFELPLIQIATHDRSGAAQMLSEGVASFALLFCILSVSRSRPEATPGAVALVIAAGYWWTPSTSFANPAITIARALSDTFAGIRPADAPAFMAAQFAGALMAWLLWDVLAAPSRLLSRLR